MQLVVFDLDTALCLSGAMESLALSQAVEDLTGSAPPREAPLVTAHLRPAVSHMLGREPSEDELGQVRARFSVHLRQQMLTRSGVMDLNVPMIEAMNRMMRRRDTLIGLISSCSGRIMQMKARSMGVVIDAVPFASGDDGDALEDILGTLRKRVKRGFGFRIGEPLLVAETVWAEAAREAGFNWQRPGDYLTRSAGTRDRVRAPA